MKCWYPHALTILALTGCGGSGGIEDTPEVQAMVCEPAKEKFVSPTAQGAGIYRGFLEAGFDEGILEGGSETSNTAEGLGLLSPSGRLAFIASSGVVTGFFSLSAPAELDGSSSLDGNVKLWNSETVSENVDLDGYITAQRNILGYCFICDYSTLGGPFYRFEAQYQVAKEDICWPSVDTTGSWSQTFDSQTTTLTFDANDQFTGSDTSGCVYQGTVSAQAIEGGVFELAATVSNCEKAGDYIGVGAVIGEQSNIAGQIFGVLWNDSQNIGLSLRR
jgi:hypothetical protein